jgi:hypothetical protein
MTRAFERRAQRMIGIANDRLRKSRSIIWCFDPEHMPAMIDLLIAKGVLSDSDRPRCVHWSAIRGTGEMGHEPTSTKRTCRVGSFVSIPASCRAVGPSAIRSHHRPSGSRTITARAPFDGAHNASLAFPLGLQSEPRCQQPLFAFAPRGRDDEHIPFGREFPRHLW